MPAWLRSVLVAAVVGAAAGLVVGGAGGRLAMRLVALAQPPEVLGTPHALGRRRRRGHLVRHGRRSSAGAPWSG